MPKAKPDQKTRNFNGDSSWHILPGTNFALMFAWSFDSPSRLRDVCPLGMVPVEEVDEVILLLVGGSVEDADVIILGAALCSANVKN